MTEWRLVPRLPHYEVSECGRVRRLTSRGGWPIGFELQPNVNENGYLRFGLKDTDGWHINLFANRLVCETWHGPPPFPGAHAAHYDGNHRNNHYTNLRWATARENASDRHRHGTVLFGERHPQAKLTEKQVLEIKARYTGKRGQFTALAREYGVGRSTITRVVKGTGWTSERVAA